MFDKTLETIEPLVKKENKEAILLLAQVYLKENNINQADEIYEDLIEKNPDNITIYLNRAQASTAMANWLRAARDWSTVLNIYSIDDRQYEVLQKCDILQIGFNENNKIKTVSGIVLEKMNDNDDELKR